MLYGHRNEHLGAEGLNRFALVIFLPDHLDGILAPMRARFDPDHNLIASHITLVAPFETRQTPSEIARVISDELQQVPSPSIELGTIGDFYPSSPIIYWSVHDDGTLNRLYMNLYTRLDLALPYKRFIPHVTMAREISVQRVLMVKEQIIRYQPQERFKPQSVDLVSPIADQTWVTVKSFSLKQSD